MSTVITAFSGFIFWTIAARFYPSRDVGLAAAVISLAQLVSMISLFGFDFGVIRFIYDHEPGKVISSSVSVVISSALVMAAGSLFFVQFISPAVSKVLTFPVNVLFVLFVVLSATAAILRQGVFVGIRDTRYSFVQSLATLPRLLFLVPLTFLKAVGIFVSFTTSPALAMFIGLNLSAKAGYKIRFDIDVPTVRKMLRYSFGNYIAGILENLPTFVLPVMIVNMLGARMNAYFYIPWAISMLLIAISRATSMSLFAECSYSQKEIIKKVLRSFKFIALLVIPGIVLIFVLGKFILMIFGKEYAANSLELLRILVFASLPFSVNIVYSAVERAKKRMSRVIMVFFTVASITLLTSYLLIPIIGLIGVGYAWLAGNIVSMVLVLIANRGMIEAVRR
jgi:O-antigen/teichoic acid export membrane protein